MVLENLPSIKAKRKPAMEENERMCRFSPSPSDSSALTSGDKCTLASEPTKYAGITSNGSDGKGWKCAYYSSRLLPYMLSQFLSSIAIPLHRRGHQAEVKSTITTVDALPWLRPSHLAHAQAHKGDLADRISEPEPSCTASVSTCYRCRYSSCT